jgi:hypothetical protein
MGSAPSQSTDTHAAALDACAPVSQEDVTTLIGVTVDGVPSGLVGAAGACGRTRILAAVDLIGKIQPRLPG